ncbi:hypothetical protein MAALD49_36790 [Marinobacter shengliensis]|nr:hypothetical protein MAALD49_36790 [Marinobacter shengliensis]
MKRAISEAVELAEIDSEIMQIFQNFKLPLFRRGIGKPCPLRILRVDVIALKPNPEL